MEELRVPKRKTLIEVVLPGGAVRRVEVFLAEFAGAHEGSERLVDLLNGEGEFFPAFDVEAKQMSFVNRSSLALVWVDAGLDAEPAEQVTIPTEHEVELSLLDGGSLRGLVTYVLPPDRARLIDYLNDPSPYFRVHQGARVALVHKRHVARIVIL